MSRQEAIEQYQDALAKGKTCAKACLRKGLSPHPAILEDILGSSDAQESIDLGVMEIPSTLVAGVRSSSRADSFASNFMPLMPLDTEFAHKWITLCEAHLSDEGIRDPVLAIEYFGRFYIQEGNKRTSVLLSFEATSIPAHVIRLLPRRNAASRAYYEFLDFYRLSGTYLVQFDRPGAYTRLLRELGLAANHQWSLEERRRFSADYLRFAAQVKRINPDASPSEALLVWLQVFSTDDLHNMSNTQLARSLKSLWPDVLLASGGAKNIPNRIVARPNSQSLALRSRMSASVGNNAALDVCFIYDGPPQSTPWNRAHYAGQQTLLSVHADRLKLQSMTLALNQTDASADISLKGGTPDVAIFTSPALFSTARRYAADHRRCKVLVCAPPIAQALVHTYLPRWHEASFIAGVIAGESSSSGLIGYVASLPLPGAMASIDAFALGVASASSKAKVLLRWEGLPGDPFDALLAKGADVIAHMDPLSGAIGGYEEGVSKIQEGRFKLLCAPKVRWDSFYTQLLDQIVLGGWSSHGAFGEGIGDWWGMEAGVIDIGLSKDLTDELKQATHLLQADLASGRTGVFERPIHRKDGSVFNSQSVHIDSKGLLAIDWLCTNIEGEIPDEEQLSIPARRIYDACTAVLSSFEIEEGR